MSGISGGGFDFSFLSGYYTAQTALRASQTQSQSLSAQRQQLANSVASNASLAPWNQPTTESATRKLTEAMSATSFVNVRDSDFEKVGVSADEKKLFALYKGLTMLQSLANKAADKKTLDGERVGLQRRFSAGLNEIKDFLSEDAFQKLTMLFGAKEADIDSTLAVPRSKSVYVGNPAVSGASANAIPGLSATDVFTVSTVKGNLPVDVTMDMSEITGDLSLDNVITYMNGKLQDAGLITRFKRQVFDGKTSDAPKQYGLAIQTVSTEKLTFAAAAATPAIYVAGVSGTGDKQAGQLVKFSDTGTAPANEFTSVVDPETGISDARASAVDADGNVYVVGSVTGDLGSGIVQGDQDVYLRKFDSAGKVVWSRLLGSSGSADGYAVAVDTSGNVAIAGRVTDRLSATATGGGKDSFVTKYDSQGREVFTRQIDPVTDDQANALAFGADGSLYIAGQTKSPVKSGITQAGGTDAYLTKLSSSGTFQYSRQFGTTGEDRASSVAVDADGNVVLATVENGTAVVRKLSPDDGTTAPIWEKTIGALGQGTLGNIVVQNGEIYVSGSTNNAALDAGGEATIAQSYGGNSDGFVMKLTDDGLNATAAFVSYVGTTASDTGVGVAVSNDGSLYVTGSTSGSFAGGTAPSTSNAYVVKLNSGGTQDWAHQYTGAGGSAVARSIVVDDEGSSVLDTLGLPRGTMTLDQSRLVTAQSSIRPGDYFYIKVNDTEARKITIKAGDTMRNLVNRINGSLALKVEASVTRGAKGDELHIEAKDGTIVELSRGDKGFDALAGLGIEPGKLYNTTDAFPSGATEKERNAFALSLKDDAVLTNETKARLASTGLDAAIQTIRNAFQKLTSKDTAATNTFAPANVQRSILNYQAALAALGGGG